MILGIDPGAKGGMALLREEDGNGIPVDYVHFGLWPVPTEMSGLAWGSGDPGRSAVRGRP
mgnify:CR=1 FL=1